MKILKAIRIFFRNLFKIIDKKIIVPITKLILKITSSFDTSGKKIEKADATIESLAYKLAERDGFQKPKQMQ